MFFRVKNEDGVEVEGSTDGRKGRGKKMRTTLNF